jgi:hypothetical protein
MGDQAHECCCPGVPPPPRLAVVRNRTGFTALGRIPRHNGANGGWAPPHKLDQVWIRVVRRHGTGAAVAGKVGHHGLPCVKVAAWTDQGRGVVGGNMHNPFGDASSVVLVQHLG